MQQPLPRGVPAFTAPSFYITGRQPLRPGAILLAIVVAVGALSSVLYALSHGGHAHFASGGSGADRSATGIAGPASAAGSPKHRRTRTPLPLAAASIRATLGCVWA